MILLKSFYDDGVFSLKGYIKTFSSPTTYKAVLNTLQLAVGVLAGTWIIGGTLAFIRQKTDFKRKKALDSFVFLSLTVPAFIVSISWIELVSRGGYLHRILNMIFPNLSYNINAYSIESSAVILSLHLYPLVYYGVGNALKLLGGSLEQSAKICGAKKAHIIFGVILPLVVPSFISTGLLVLSRSMANFGVPAQLSLPVGKEVLTTRIFGAMSDLDFSVVFVLSLVLIVVSLALFLLSERALKKRNYDVTIVAQYDSPSYVRLGKWQSTIGVLIYVFFLLTIAIPLVTIVISSFFKCWGLDLNINNLTLGNYAKLFSKESLLIQPLLNSLLYGIVAATLAALIASLTVYFHKYSDSILTKWLLSVAQLPIAIPNMILAIASIFAWINEPLKLYGTGTIIIVTYAVLFIPICIKQMLGAAKNLDPSLDFAAQTMGISPIIRYTRLFVPQIKDSLTAGVLICFLISLKEIPISLLLHTPDTKTLGVMMFTVQSGSYGLEMTSAISVIVIALSVAGNLILRRISSKGNKKYE